MQDFPIRARAYLASVALVAAAAVTLLAAHFGIPRAVLGFALLFLLAEIGSVTARDTSYSVSYVIGMAALVALGPAAAAVAAAFGGVDLLLRRRHRDWVLRRFIFNSAQYSLATAISGTTY